MTDSGPRPSDKYIPLWFVAFFLVVFGVNAVMVTLAVRTSPGVVATHHYERGLAYNTYLAKQTAQTERGWTGELVYEKDRLHVVLKDRQGQLLNGATVRVQLSRPVAAGADFEVTLAEVTAGVYQVATTFPHPGLWTATVVATRQGENFRQSQDIIVEP